MMVIAISLTSIMLVLGLALLAIVDTQAQQSGKERLSESAFNLAEGALNAESFLIARNWPTVAPAASSCSTAASINGNLTTAHPVQSILASSFRASDYTNAPATWKINVCDDNAPVNATEDCASAVSDIWSDAKLAGAAGFDANRNCRVWLRVQTLVHGRKRAVAGLVVVQRPLILPEGYSVLGGAFSGQLTYATSQLTGGSLLSRLTDRLLVTRKLVDGGKIGVRCGLSSLCVEGVFTGLSASALRSLLLANDTVQYGSPTAVSDDVIAGFRAQAQRDGMFVQSVAPGASCIPAGATSYSTIFVELVGTGDSPSQYCTISTTSNPTYQMIVVAKGAMRVQGAGTVTGVLYGVNRQRESLGDNRAPRGCANLLNTEADPCEVIRVEAGAHVRGALFADGATGDVNIYPGYTANPATCKTVDLVGNLGLPAGATLLTTSVSICGEDMRTLLNSTTATVNVVVQIRTILGVTESLTVSIKIANVGNPTDLVDGFVNQISASSSPVTYDAGVVSNIRGFGSSGTVAGTFRAIPPN